MTNKEFIQSIENTFKDGVEIIKIKNADYANSENPFKNFESAIVAGVDIRKAIIVRVLDKISRIVNLLEKKASVKDEKLEDTIIDCINYLAILKAKLEER